MSRLSNSDVSIWSSCYCHCQMWSHYALHEGLWLIGLQRWQAACRRKVWKKGFTMQICLHSTLTRSHTHTHSILDWNLCSASSLHLLGVHSDDAILRVSLIIDGRSLWLQSLVCCSSLMADIRKSQCVWECMGWISGPFWAPKTGLTLWGLVVLTLIFITIETPGWNGMFFHRYLLKISLLWAKINKSWSTWGEKFLRNSFIHVHVAWFCKTL